MLIKPRFLKPTPEQVVLNKQFMSEGHFDMFEVETLQHGFYSGVEQLVIDRYDVDYDWLHSKDRIADISLLPHYGLVDTVEQFDEKFGKNIREHSKPMCVFFTLLTKKDNPSVRWHKQGTYYGKRTLLAESFGDEPEIEEMLTFHLIVFKDSILPCLKFNHIIEVL